MKKIALALGLGLLFLSAAGRSQEQKQELQEEPEQTVKPAQGATVETPEPQPKAQTPEEPKPEPEEKYPAREIDRPLLIPPKTYEMRSSVAYFSTHTGFNSDGDSEPLKPAWRMFTMTINAGYGVFSWAELGGSVSFYSGQEVYAKGQNIGDFSTYSLCDIYRSKNKDRELAAGLRISLPTGNPNRKETLVDEKVRPEALTTGDPALDFFPSLQTRWTIKKFALRGLAEYGYRMPGKTQTGIDVLQEYQDFAPGQSLEAEIDAIYQHNDKLAVFARLNYFNQAGNKLADESLDDAKQLLSVIPGMEFQFAPDYDLLLMVELPLLGKNYPRAYPIAACLKSRF